MNDVKVEESKHIFRHQLSAQTYILMLESSSTCRTRLRVHKNKVREKGEIITQINR